MRVAGIAVTFAVAAVINVMSAHAAGLANNPDAATIYLLQCEFSHVAPQYEAMAQWDDAVRSADEFHKSEAIYQADANLRASSDSVEGVKTIVVNLANHFSEYDSQYGEYDFDINDGTYISYKAFGRDVRIALTNGTAAQTWTLKPQDAETVLRKNKGQRYATLVLTLALLDSPPAVSGEPMVLNVRVVGYDVLTALGNVKLGSVVVENKP
jgi:hypothetical protein